MTLPTATTIYDIGGWCFAVVVLALILVAIVRGDLVPGWIHKREIERGDKITALMSQQTATMEKQTDATERQTSIITGMGSQIETLVSVLRPSARGRQ